MVNWRVTIIINDQRAIEPTCHLFPPHIMRMIPVGAAVFQWEFIFECLARLAAVFGSNARTNSVERMEAHAVSMLTHANATARLAGAHFLTLWLHVVPPGPERPSLQEPGAKLAAILANTNPAYPSAPSPASYGEVAQMVKYVKSESMAFLRVAATNGVEVTGEVPSPEADGFGADSAATLSAAVPQVCVL